MGNKEGREGVQAGREMERGRREKKKGDLEDGVGW